ncbi:hypothetical protein FACS1894179_08510 [Bacteroidia bacterium]|nr:hypothetical protein FACS1894179_08510 [Bacteroidia bacterium]
MMLQLDKLKEILLLNAYTVESLGYLNGKAGTALTLFELARYLNDDSIENHAFDLLQETLAYDITDNEFSNGKAGIAYVVHYLIKNRFLDADYLELYGKQQEGIIESIVSQHKGQNPYKWIGDLFFILSLSVFIPRKNYIECLNILSTNIFKELDDLHEKASLETAITFYNYTSKLLNLCCSVNIPDDVVNQILHKIKRTNKKLSDQDCICNNLLYPILLFFCSKKQQEQDIQKNATNLIQETMKNILIPTLDFRQKTDLIFNIFRLYRLDHKLDFRDSADNILKTIIDDDTAILEEKIYNNIFKKPEDSIGIGTGISRLILLVIYLNEIRTGNLSEHIVELFN